MSAAQPSLAIAIRSAIMSPLRIFKTHRRFHALRRLPAKVIASIRSKKTATPVRIDADLKATANDHEHSQIAEISSPDSGHSSTEPETAPEAVWDTEVDDSDFESLSMRCSNASPKKPITPVMDLFALPPKVIEAIVSNLDTGSLHAFRNTCRRAAALTAFRGIQTHLLHIDPEARPGQIHSIQSKGKIITTAALDAVLNTERVKVRHLLKIGSFHPADMELVADHIDSRFKSIVLEGYVNYKIFYSLIVPGKTVTMRLKDGIQLPASNSSRFWNYFPDQRISHVRRCFNSNHVFVKATYDEATDSHTLRVVPAPDWRPLYG